MSGFFHSLIVQSWTLWSIGIIFVICRLVSRKIKLGSWGSLQIEDYWMCFASVTFTAVIVAINEVARNGSNYMSPEAAAALTIEQVAQAIYGSKMTLVLEICTLTTLWSIKGCLLILYYRLTEAFNSKRIAVITVACFCGVSYVLVVALCLMHWCTPIEEYWRVPVKYSQCATYYDHMIFATSFNVSSDLMLLAIPIPLIIRTQFPLKRKLILCCVLGSSSQILTAILNRYYNFSHPNDLSFMYWYVGEVSTAVIVANLPLCWPVLRIVIRGSSWSKQRSSDELEPPNNPRTGRFSRKPKSVHSLTWLGSRGGTTWDKVEEREGWSTGSKDPMVGRTLDCVAEDQGSEIELTPGWHHEANLSSINAERVSDKGSRRGESRAESRDRRRQEREPSRDRGVKVVTTVEISREG
ncbi:uncharacterized protein BCR38DRAFT_375428 [Pseudomassariella vexata]|uniref:Rhodopsin domain-containing protein n=1 Tax=Pseudomassariella vexata TaxID=1141098 RepID=A0A1Y2DM96_9PEZI|nr:uncharacterized protein BCR38DRAFT_375428 [Pseudomassariella vexata]ORY60269.1 hypothetical protein BCR38DRAFT_375428 [Pseudomassariella vexata]